MQRQHAERRADDAADRGDPLVVDRVGVFYDDADKVGDHDDCHAGGQSEDVFHFLFLLK